MKTMVICDGWRSLRKNTLLGFCIIKLPALRLTIRDVAVHEKNGRRWAALPARPQVKDGRAIADDTGKVKYFTLLEFDDRATANAFGDAVCAAVLKYDPRAFDENDHERARTMAGAGGGARADMDDPF